MRCWHSKIVKQAPQNFKYALPIQSPANGTIVDLAATNNPITALRMFGEGIALRISGRQVFSPVNGKIIEFSPTCQRVRIKAKSGADVLLRFVDDVSPFMGANFYKDARIDQTISKGNSLFRFDLNQLKTLNTNIFLSVTIRNADKLQCILPNPNGQKVMASVDNVMTLYI
jgi:phosphotransferase system IIA component